MRSSSTTMPILSDLKKLYDDFVIRNITFIPELFYKGGRLTFRYKLFFRVLPLVNFFHDLFFDGRAPTLESAKSLLDIMGLLNALLLAAFGSVFASVTFSDLTDADQRFSDPTLGYKKYWDTYYTVPPSSQLYFDVSNCLTMFFVGILIVVYVYTDMLGKVGGIKDHSFFVRKLKQEDSFFAKNKSFDAGEEINTEPEEKSDESSDDQKMNKVDEQCFFIWWAYAKFSLLASIMTTMLGCIYCVLTCNVMLVIKYPDYYIEQYGAITSKPECPTGYGNYFFKIVFGISAMFTIFVCGLGTAAKYRVEEDHRKKAEIFVDKLKKEHINKHMIPTDQKYTNLDERHMPSLDDMAPAAGDRSKRAAALPKDGDAIGKIVPFDQDNIQEDNA